MTDKSKAQQEWDELVLKNIDELKVSLNKKFPYPMGWIDGVRWTLNNLDKVPKVAELIEALEEVLSEGNMAMQGHWDSTTKMKDIAYSALVKFKDGK